MKQTDGENDSGAGREAKKSNRSSKKRRRWPWILGGVILGLILLVVLLPTILSLGPARSIVLGRVNKAINGAARMDALSLGWFSGVRVEKLEVADAAGETVLAVESIRIPAGLLSMLGSNLDLGAIEINGPQVNIELRKDGTNNLLDLLPPAAESTEPAPAAAPGPLGFDLRTTVKVTGGAIRIRTPTGKPLEIRELGADVTVAGLSESITFGLRAALGSKAAALDVSGSARIMEKGVVRPEALACKAKLALDSFDLADLRPLLAVFGVPVEAEGVLSVQTSTEFKGAGSLHGKGTVALRSLKFAGGPLGGDQPAVSKLDLNFDIDLADGRVHVRAAQLKSPLLSAGAEGTLAMPRPGQVMSEGDFRAEASVDLAAVAGQLPETLRLRQGLLIESGRLDLNAAVKTEGGIARFESALKLTRLTARRGDQLIRPSGAVALTLKGEHGGETPRVELLHLEAPFADLRGHGTPDAFEMVLTADLAAAAREAAKFVRLDEYRAAGRLAARVGVAPAGGERAQRAVSASVKVTGLDLRGPGGMSLKEESLSATLAAVARLDEKYALQELTGVEAAMVSSIAEAKISAKSLIVGAGIKEITASDIRFAAETPAEKPEGPERLLNALRGLGFLPPDVSFTGHAKVGGSASLARGEVRVPALDVSLTNFDLQAQKGTRILLERGDIRLADLRLSDLTDPGAGLVGKVSARLRVKQARLPDDLAGSGRIHLAVDFAPGEGGAILLKEFAASVADLDITLKGKRLREPKLLFSATGSVDPAKRAASLAGGKLTLAAGSVGIGRLTVADWAALPNGVAAEITGDLDVVKFLKQFGDFVALPEGATAAGSLHLQATASAADNRQTFDVAATVSDLDLRMAGAPEITERRVELRARGTALPADEKLDLDLFKVASSMFNIEGKAALSGWAKTRHLLADGRLGFDLDRMQPLIAGLSGQEIEISGKQSKPFRIETQLGAGDWRAILRRTVAGVGIHVQRAKLKGIEAKDFTLALKVDKAAVTADVDAVANEGRLSMAPVLDISGETAVMTLPADSKVLVGARLTNEMAREFLSGAVPILRDALDITGRIGFQSHSLRLPLDATLKQKGALAGALGFEKVSFNATGTMDQVLGLITHGRNRIVIPDQQVAVSMKDGYFHQAPMRLHVGEYPVTLRSKVGLVDKSLDMRFDVPITKAIVGDRKIREALAGETLELRVRGTTERPQIDRESFHSSVRKLIQKAAKERLKREARDRLKDLFKKL